MRTAPITALLFLPLSLAAAQSASRLPPIGTDTFVTKYPGVPDGTQVLSLVQSGTGYRYTQSMSVPGVMTLTIAADFDSSLTVLRTRVFGYLGRLRVANDMEYDGRHATGRAVNLTTGVTANVDTMLPPGAFDDSGLFPILLSRPWSVGNSATFTVYDTDEQTVTKQTFRVLSREEIQVGAVRRMALRGELATPKYPMTLWFTEARPHRLLKIVSAKSETVRTR